jgi:predicted  nucleic acid-binding Zn-ribbon protein
MAAQLNESSNLNEIIGWVVAAILIIGGTSWVVIKYVITKAFKEIDSHKDKISDLELRLALLTQSTGGMQGDIVILKDSWKRSNEVMGEISNSIKSFDANMKIWHKDISIQNAEIKQSMDRSNNLVEQANRTNAELMGVLKEMRK